MNITRNTPKSRVFQVYDGSRYVGKFWRMKGKLTIEFADKRRLEFTGKWVERKDFTAKALAIVERETPIKLITFQPRAASEAADMPMAA